jgi:hypothetical protein
LSASPSDEIASLLSEIHEAVNERYELGRAVRADIGGEDEDREIPAFALMEINPNEDIDRYEAAEAEYYRAHPDEAAKQREHDQATALSIRLLGPRTTCASSGAKHCPGTTWRRYDRFSTNCSRQKASCSIRTRSRTASLRSSR